MKSTIQCECMNKKCNTIVIGHGYRLDGISCPRCGGPVMPKPFEQLNGKGNTRYKCLCCDHDDLVQVTKEEYQEVLVCPKCNGAFVDVWKIAKYKQNEPLKKHRLDGFNKLMELGLLTVNEIRELNGLGKVPGGEKLYKQI